MPLPYDSTPDTLEYIENVRTFMAQITAALEQRALMHDRSKLEPPEKEAYDKLTPLLKGTTYGSEEYRAILRRPEMKEAIRHHYQNNSHHPEYWVGGGVDNMDLLDIVEMLCDWKAASLRHADGDILESLGINRERFSLTDQLTRILYNTLLRMGWAEAEQPKTNPK